MKEQPYISGKIKIPVWWADINSEGFCVKTDFAEVYIEKVLYNNPVTVVFWSDDTKTVSRCHGDDIYSKETGLAVCIMKKMVGTTETRNIFMDWIPEDDSKTVRLSDVRRKIKARNK